MTTETNPSLPDLYARVSKACPEISTQPIQYFHGSGWRSYNIFSIPESVASDLILASCVRWLADNGHQPICIEKNNSDRTPPHHPQYLPGRFIVEIMDTPIYQQTFSDNLTIAALLAVEAVCKERSHD